MAEEYKNILRRFSSKLDVFPSENSGPVPPNFCCLTEVFLQSVARLLVCHGGCSKARSQIRGAVCMGSASQTEVAYTSHIDSQSPGLC